MMAAYLECPLNKYLQQRLQWARSNQKGVLLNPDEVKEVWKMASEYLKLKQQKGE